MAVRSAPGTERSEMARRGQEIYERDIEPTLDDSQHGHYVSIDVDTGRWTIADKRRASIDELYERYPDARDVWMLRVGYRALVGFHGAPPREDDLGREVKADGVELSSEASPTPVRTRAGREATHRRGEEIYERDVEPLLADGQRGRIVAIDVDSGCWAIADDELQASDDLRTQRPEAMDVWLLRVGYRVTHSFAGHWSRYPR
ncbi:MAG: hypothetical protein OXH86_09365 [Acidimicrobiaceae bacterium]|nr:hypothetical protein [Acidimicrobiaceae bacterium]